MRPLWLAVALIAALPVVTGCSTYRDDLARSQHALEENRHEEALAILRMLEPDTSQLASNERARYAYIRGMTDYRIGYKADARHWLAVAKATDQATPGVIPTEWRSRLDTSLAELDAQVFAGGMESLSNANVKPHAPRVHRTPRNDPQDDTLTDEEQEQPKAPPPKKKKPVDDEDE